jgi:LmbE family N-acetylglucosaminyl deacetylase
MPNSKVIQAIVWIFLGFFSFTAQSQSFPPSKIYHQILQLRETKRVLYVAAHPDDENTRLIAYLANGEHASVAYLSLTRGDGGQNLIGKELGIELGQIRTQELLKARQTDGGKQYFTRAMDFGFSKNPTETLQNWDKQKVLADVVWAIRSFQPDVIITRFNTIPGVTHGHHTTSAILAGEAFDLAGKAEAFPEQLQWVKPWQAKRLFFNAYNFQGEFDPVEGKKYYIFQVGGYDPLLGETYHQIAADSRTMHKSQGFGSTAGIGQAKDYVEFLKGEDFKENAFEGIADRWESVRGGKEIKAQLDQLLLQFNFTYPERNVPALLQLRSSLLAIEAEEIWVAEKVKMLDQVIFNSLGIDFEFNVRKPAGIRGEEIKAELVFNNPSSQAISGVKFRMLGTEFSVGAEAIKDNKTQSLPISFLVPEDAPYTQPYWLENPINGALFQVKEQTLIGKPFNEETPSGILEFSVGNQQFEAEVPLRFKYNDQVDGEVKQPFIIVPEVDLAVSKENVFLVSGADPTLTVTVNFRDQFLEGELDFEGIDSTQFKILSIEDVSFQKKRIYQVAFLPSQMGKKSVTARFTTASGKRFNQLITSISYKHIPNLTYLSPASFNLIQTDWKLSGAKIGYVSGAGDDVPGVLTALGYKLTFIGPEDFTVDYLSQFKAIVVGIRAYNTNEVLAANQQALMGYVRSGGNLIVQYNTNSPLLTNQLGPYPFTVGRDRVAVQDSPVTADWSNPVLSSPNQLTPEDLEGWVQERGLYFATAIDPAYRTPFIMNDPEEKPNNGSLIVATYGQGSYAYSGLSFFRQMPAGITGAIKLFVNLIEQ